ncbi:hypothetical protein GIB67_008665 [Kingdonia uniflora]|uniref:Uncharacterized protein n=1 Tax=Kingdonia uniflora TaxID=39325 RepID=A0A7J7M593_9MAGN|nr:hypothetical protein GIB67_008665 [Kingdonia uniflora]
MTDAKALGVEMGRIRSLLISILISMQMGMRKLSSSVKISSVFFLSTPVYITPDGQQISSFLDGNKENVPCPKLPEKMTTARAKRYRHGIILGF